MTTGHDFTPDWKLSQQDQLQVHLSIALAKHVPDWPGATDEQLAAVAGDLSPVIAKAIDDAVREERERCKVFNADVIAMILAENPDASPAYLAVQICERIENA
jgi:hypothetical protein